MGNLQSFDKPPEFMHTILCLLIWNLPRCPRIPARTADGGCSRSRISRSGGTAGTHGSPRPQPAAANANPAQGATGASLRLNLPRHGSLTAWVPFAVAKAARVRRPASQSPPRRLLAYCNVKVPGDAPSGAWSPRSRAPASQSSDGDGRTSPCPASRTNPGPITGSSVPPPSFFTRTVFPCSCRF
jgi:hypothetical protein